MYADEELPPGWLTQFRRGVFSGAGLLLLAVAGCTVPAFLVWLVPGADTTPATSAVKAGALLALAAAHGGIRLNGQAVTLVPLLVTVLLGWLVAGQARRSDSWSAVLGLSVGYGVGSGVLARWAELGSTRAPSLRSAVAGLLFVVIVGGGARAADEIWPRLSARFRQVMRAAAGVLAVYVGAGALLVTASLMFHFSEVSAIQRQVAPGAAGLPIALLGIGASPNAILAGIGYLTGPGAHLGSHTSVSAVSASHGRLPEFPLTAALPAHVVPALGVLLIALTAVLAGGLALRLVSAERGVLARLTDAGAAAVLAGGVLAVASAVSSGGIGSGALSSIGTSWWAVGAASIGLVALGSAAWAVLGHLRSGAQTSAPASASRWLRSVPTEAEQVERPASKEKASKPDGDRSRHVS